MHWRNNLYLYRDFLDAYFHITMHKYATDFPYESYKEHLIRFRNEHRDLFDFEQKNIIFQEEDEDEKNDG